MVLSDPDDFVSMLGVTKRYAGVTALDNVDFRVSAGEAVCLAGENGSGKSTILKNIYRLYKPDSGKILLDNKNLLNMKDKDCAKEIAVLAQESNSQFDFTVEQIVKMGRYPYKSVFEDYSKKDLDMVTDMLKRVGLEDYVGRSFSKLSGGEKQRTLIARALVQDTEFLILDEPTNHLDIPAIESMMESLDEYNGSLLLVSHDPTLVRGLETELLVMDNGKFMRKMNYEEYVESM